MDNCALRFTDERDNIALRKKGRLRSVYGDQLEYLATDGKRDSYGDIYTKERSCARSTTKGVWYKINLGKVYDIGYVKVYIRSSSKYFLIRRLIEFFLFVYFECEYLIV